METVEN